MPASTILNQTEFSLYQRERDAALKVLGEENSEIQALKQQMALYEEEQAIKTQHPIEELMNDEVVNPVMGMGWTMLLGIGVILQETVKVTTPLLSAFLFPLNFVIDGLRNIWELYRNLKNQNLPQRKTLIGTNIIHIAALIAASIVIALVITNPFALPIIFLGINATTLYKNNYVLSQTNALIRRTKTENASVEEEIRKLSGNPKAEAQIHYLKAKQDRINVQLNRLYGQRFELHRQNLFTSMALVSVSVLLTSAILTLVFPPLAPLVATAGMLFFASTIISNILTSPPVRQKITRFIDWLMGIKESNNAPGPGGNLEIKGNQNSYTTVIARQENTVTPGVAEPPSSSNASANQKDGMPTKTETTARVSNSSIFLPDYATAALTQGAPSTRSNPP